MTSVIRLRWAAQRTLHRYRFLRTPLSRGHPFKYLPGHVSRLVCPQASSETAYDKPGFDAEAAEHRRDEFFQVSWQRLSKLSPRAKHRFSLKYAFPFRCKEQMGASEQLTRDMAAGMQKQPSFQEKVDLSSNHDPGKWYPGAWNNLGTWRKNTICSYFVDKFIPFVFCFRGAPDGQPLCAG